MVELESVVKANTPPGFSVELIHRDSPLSPFYNPSLTSLEILTNNTIRSRDRVKHLQSLVNQKVIQSVVAPVEVGVDYMMKLSFGTPPVEYWVVIDTGSDLSWIQRVPCTKCYSQSSSLFDPKASSTYKAFSSDSQTCRTLTETNCSKTNDCQYHVYYGDMSRTIGVLSSDTLSFGSQKATFPLSIFGCGHGNQLTVGIANPGIAGLVGLGWGNFSLVSQIRTQIDHRLSYCFVPQSAKSSGKLSFGQESIISRPGVVSTPLVSKFPETYYYLTLEGVSIGDKTVRSSSGQGNIVIDSGTTMAYLEQDLYDGLEAMLRDVFGEEPVQDFSSMSRLCFRTDNNISVPEMVFHFTGADIRLQPVNTFEVDGNLACMLIFPNHDILSIFGNTAQINFQVEYDLLKRTISFAPTDCTQQ
ncbi:Detected protein of unknown function [Hibiscus syriacus]|uniref:Peptidase A1 domain-containing protein n=1 Tax=Hibiscus syriacus TaxID=106335 RepID=A0A6A2WUE1_HIBSY|nr:aspartic proteinase CDR1-like [Hibiscus syriacus]KAE8658620.1 Detected protein of unknown function [Hibiscus syriacus]